MSSPRDATDRSWVPVDRCTLPSAEQPLRVAALDELLAAALATVERPADRPHAATLVLTGGADLEARVADFAAQESSCCSFFSFTVRRRDARTVALDVEVPPAQGRVLEALVGRAARGAAGRS